MRVLGVILSADAIVGVGDLMITTTKTETITTKDMDANENIVERLKQWMEDEGMSSLTEYGANTPMYIYRMWGDEVSLWQIKRVMKKAASEG